MPEFDTPSMTGVKSALKTKIGPIPAWGWGIALLGGVVGFVYLKRKGTSPFTPTNGGYGPGAIPANGSGGGSSGGTIPSVPPSSVIIPTGYKRVKSGAPFYINPNAPRGQEFMNQYGEILTNGGWSTMDSKGVITSGSFPGAVQNTQQTPEESQRIADDLYYARHPERRPQTNAFQTPSSGSATGSASRRVTAALANMRLTDPNAPYHIVDGIEVAGP